LDLTDQMRVINVFIFSPLGCKALIKHVVTVVSVWHYCTLQPHCWTAPLGPLLTLLFPLLGKADIAHLTQSTKHRQEQLLLFLVSSPHLKSQAPRVAFWLNPSLKLSLQGRGRGEGLADTVLYEISM